MSDADDGLVVVVRVKYDKASLDVPLDLDRTASHFLLEVERLRTRIVDIPTCWTRQPRCWIWQLLPLGYLLPQRTHSRSERVDIIRAWIVVLFLRL